MANPLADAGEGAGVNELNRTLQRAYRAATVDLARSATHERKISKPGGPQEIVYGDKVINVRNKTRRHYYPRIDTCLEYVANGEIGVVTGAPLGQRSTGR